MNSVCHNKAGMAAVAGMLGVLLGGPAGAAPIAVINPGFEDISGETVQSEFTFGALNGWDLYDPDGVAGAGMGGGYFIGTLTPQPDPGNPGGFINFTDGALEGARVGIAFDFAGNDVGNGGGEYGFVQTLAAVLAANTRYDLSVGIGNIASGNSLASGFFNLDGFPGYRVDLLAGDEVIASDNNTLAGTIPEGEFRLSTVSFTTGVSHARLGEALAIRLVNLNVLDPTFPAADLEVDFDNVQLSAVVVPLPAMAPVVALLLAGAVSVRRR